MSNGTIYSVNMKQLTLQSYRKTAKSGELYIQQKSNDVNIKDKIWITK